MTLNEAADYADLTPGALRIAARDGRLKAVKIGRDWITTQSAVDRYVAARWGGREQRPRRPSATPAAASGATDKDPTQ